MAMSEGLFDVPDVSIIVPAFNPQKEYLSEMIASLLNQDYKSFEVLIVDDGSDDSHRAVIDEIANTDERIEVIHKQHRGVSAARNTGLACARGRLLTFVDSDDHVCPGFLSDAVKAIDGHHSDMVIGWVRHVDSKSAEEDPYFIGEPDVVLVEDDLASFRSFTLAAIPPKSLSKYRAMSVSTVAAKVFTRDVVKDLWVDENLSYSEDSLFNVMLLERANKAVIVNRVWYEYVDRPGSATNRPAVEMLSKISAVTYYQQVVTSLDLPINDISLHTAKFVLQLFSSAAGEISLFQLAAEYRTKVPLELKEMMKRISMDEYSLSPARRVAMSVLRSGSPFLIALTLKINSLIRS